MEKMIVTIFNTEAAAYDGVSALKALNDGGDITLYATAVLAKDADGKVSVKQVVLNLLSNAIKYNRRGGHVWLEAQPEGDKLDG